MTSRSYIACALATLGATFTGLAVPAELPAVQFEVVLVPAERWSAGAAALGHRVAAAELHLFRPGDLAPFRSVSGDLPFDLEVGSWLFRGEAPGFVTAATAQIEVGAIPYGAARRLVWPIHRACEVRLPERERLRGVTRLDLVSVEHGEVYRVDPAKKARQRLPVGTYFGYGVSGRGDLTGILRPAPCVADAEPEQAVPAAPAAGFQDFLVTVSPPAGVRFEEAPLVFLESPAGKVYLPKISTSNQGRWSFVYYNVSALEAMDLVVRAPGVRAERRAIPAAGGVAREILVDLRTAPELVAQIDYAPRTDHRSAYLELRDCSDPRGFAGGRRRDCAPRGERVALRTGLEEYRFGELDTGSFRLDAWIDGEWLPALLQGAQARIGETDDEVRLEALRLVEEEVHGQILLDDEAVAGEVRALSHHPGSGMRTFPTDTDLEYRMTYFAGKMDPRTLLGGETRRKDEIWWGFGMMNGLLSACTADGECESYPMLSTLLGSGRLDFHLHSGLRLELRVEDARTGEPVAGAQVSGGTVPKVLFFESGEVEWLEPASSPGSAYQRTGAEGEALLRVAGDAGATRRISVSAEGYRGERFDLVLEPGTTVRRTVALELVEGEEVGALRFEDGAPVAFAGLLLLRSSGWDPRCLGGSDDRGYVQLTRACAEGEWFLVVHPEARLELLPTTDLWSGRPVRVPRAPARPLIARVVDSAGNPVPRTPVDLLFARARLRAFDLLASLRTTGGYLPFLYTDEAGEIVLRGVDPSALDAPAIAVAGEKRGVDPSHLSPGEALELLFDP